MAAAGSALPEYPTDATEGQRHLKALIDRYAVFAANGCGDIRFPDAFHVGARIAGQAGHLWKPLYDCAPHLLPEQPDAVHVVRGLAGRERDRRTAERVGFADVVSVSRHRLHNLFADPSEPVAATGSGDEAGDDRMPTVQESRKQSGGIADRRQRGTHVACVVKNRGEHSIRADSSENGRRLDGVFTVIATLLLPAREPQDSSHFASFRSLSPQASIRLCVVELDRRSAHSKECAMSEEKTTADRLTAFSDAVFAVIVTVMVLELKAPDQSAFSALRPLRPTAISYAVSYLFIAVIWINHHHLMLLAGPPSLD
jgi:hypothetical protein